MSLLLLGGSSSTVLPPIPSRDTLCQVRTTGMQGLWVQTDKYGFVPWWEAVITSPDVTEADRLRAYTVKRDVGDTCQIINVSWNYQAPHLIAPFAGRDLWNDMPTLRAYITEALTVGGMQCVLLMLAGDGNEYSSDGGTYGFDLLMSNFQRIYNGLKGTQGEGPDLTPYIVWCDGYDGTVPGWQPWSKVEQWLLFARGIIGPTAVLAIELSAGYWCYSGEHNDWAEPAGQCCDVILYEFPYPFGPTTMSVPDDFCNRDNDTRAPFDQVWQISKRLLGTQFKRPAEMPACDDGGLAPDLPTTPRGPVYKIPFETNTYGFVRGYDTLNAINADRQYQASIGWSYIR